MRPWSPFEIRYGTKSGRSLTTLRQLLLSEQGASWTYSLEFLKAQAAENLDKSMTEFDRMSKTDKAEEMALIVARGWMSAWERREVKK